MKRTTISVIALTLCLLFAASCFAACGSSNGSDNNKSALIGTWESVEAPGTSYTFGEDGKGSLDANGSVMNFTYTDKDGKLELTYDGTSSAQVSNYTIKDNVLSITDAEYGTTLTYNKK